MIVFLIGIVEGDKEYKFLNSNITIAQLEDGITNTVVSFNVGEVYGTKLMGLVNFEDTAIGESMFLDSPYNGRCEGTLGWRWISIVDFEDLDHPTFTYLHTHMVNFGNGVLDVLRGMCGSTILTEENKVATRFR